MRPGLENIYRTRKVSKAVILLWNWFGFRTLRRRQQESKWNFKFYINLGCSLQETSSRESSRDIPCEVLLPGSDNTKPNPIQMLNSQITKCSQQLILRYYQNTTSPALSPFAIVCYGQAYFSFLKYPPSPFDKGLSIYVNFINLLDFEVLFKDISKKNMFVWFFFHLTAVLGIYAPG